MKALVIMITISTMLVGCKISSKLHMFKEQDGVLSYTDTSNSPFENGGVKIEIKKGNQGYVKFIKTDDKGNPTVDYFNFDAEKEQVEKYYYVPAMGTGYYYYYDLKNKALTKIEDIDHVDSTQKIKDANRWDNAVSKVKEEVKTLEDYFSKQYNITIKEASLN